MRNRLLIAILGIFLTLFLNARPTRPTATVLTQPDGSTFTAKYFGDEFQKIITTSQGHAIIHDNDGWWSYAIYNSDGSKASSGCHVGTNAPAAVLAGSLSIPYEALSQHARAKKNPAEPEEEENILKRVRTAKGVQSDGKVTKHGIVILAQFSDMKFKYTRENFIDLITKKGYDTNGADGSAKDYFESQFNGLYEFAFDVSEIVTLSHPSTYYGQNDEYGDDLRPAEMIKEACELASAAGIDFSLYDDDDDTYVDNVFVIFAGKDEADDPANNENCIWSHAWHIRKGAGINLIIDGKRIDQYACTSELMRLSSGKTYTLTGIGTFCHEFSHTLGLPDFYDTDYETNGWAAGLWRTTSLMDGGNSNNESNTPPFFNAIEREIMGLTEPQEITHNGIYTLKPIQAVGTTYKIPSDKPDEYYLLECRNNKGWDEYIGGYGMLVYHIEKSNIKIWEEYNEVNTNPRRQNADLIEADGRTDILTESNYWSLMDNISGVFFPYAGNTSLTPESSPGIRFRNGSKATISITGIKRDGENIIFTVTGLLGEEPPTPINVKTESFMDAAILNFESDRPFEGDALVEWGRSGQFTLTEVVTPYETGKYAVILEGLTPDNKTYTATISFEVDGTVGQSKKVSFMTSRSVPVSWPYIHFGKAANEDGTFGIGAKLPLRVYNASEAEAIEWEFNGKPSGPEGDGYLTVTEGGVLRAIVYWPDGSTDILEKNIILSE